MLRRKKQAILLVGQKSNSYICTVVNLSEPRLEKGEYIQFQCIVIGLCRDCVIGD